MRQQLLSPETIDSAYIWLCKSRLSYPANTDIWDLRWHWETERASILLALSSGHYQFRPLELITKKDNTTVALWGARDALVMKMLSLVLTNHLPLHSKCEHLKGHGGGKTSAHRVDNLLKTGEYRYVCRTDIKGYYANIDKTLLLNQLSTHVSDPIIFSLLVQYIHYSVEYGGNFHTPQKGISRGSALSPLIGAFHLYVMDAYFSGDDTLYYARYMDDFIIFTKTRWHLRKAVKKLNQFFDQFSFKQHPDKTFIGKIEKGFDWMGFQFTLEGCIGIAQRSLEKIAKRVTQLYEQNQPLRLIERSLRYFDLGPSKSTSVPMFPRRRDFSYPFAELIIPGPIRAVCAPLVDIVP